MNNQLDESGSRKFIGGQLNSTHQDLIDGLFLARWHDFETRSKISKKQLNIKFVQTLVDIGGDVVLFVDCIKKQYIFVSVADDAGSYGIVRSPYLMAKKVSPLLFDLKFP